MMNRERAIEIIRSLSLAQYTDQLTAALEPSIGLRTRRVDESSLPLGASRIGGSPDFPAGREWPSWHASRPEMRGGSIVHTEATQSHLHFIAQIQLKDVAGFQGAKCLPQQGMLFFFFDAESQPWGYDPNDRGGARVLFFDGRSSDLIRTSRPAPEGDYSSHPCALSCVQEWTLPSWNELALDTDHYDDYEELLADLYEMPSDGCPEPLHRLLGHSQNVQNEMKLECELVSHGVYCGDSSGYDTQEFATGANDWQLLLQIDTDDRPGWMWGDSGRIYYWIRRQDLAERRFDKAWAILQCY